MKQEEIRREIKPLDMDQGEALAWIRNADTRNDETLTGRSIHPDLEGVVLNLKVGIDKALKTIVVVNYATNLPSTQMPENSRVWRGHLVGTNEHVFNNIGAARAFFVEKARKLAEQYRHQSAPVVVKRSLDE